MQNIQLAVFDIAGTTVEDKGVVNRAFAEAFALTGLENIDPDAIDAVMGYGKMEAIAIILDQYLPDYEGNRNEIMSHVHEQFTSSLVRKYRSDAEVKALPYAEETFRALKEKGILIALNTGFGREITNVLLERLDWDDHPMIDAVICSDEVKEGRPHAWMIQALMEDLGISDPKQIAKIGDTVVDIQEGRQAGCGIVIAVTTGAQNRDTLLAARPDYIINSLQELPLLLCK